MRLWKVIIKDSVAVNNEHVYFVGAKTAGDAEAPAIQAYLTGSSLRTANDILSIEISLVKGTYLGGTS